MSDKKIRFTLTAAVGSNPKGASIELTEAQAASPLYASRIASVGQPGEAEQIIADAKAEAKRIVEAAQAEAMKLAVGGKK